MSVSYQAIAQDCASFFASTTVKAGNLCIMNVNSTVRNCSAGEAFHGVVQFVRESLASVVVRGFVTVKYTGTAPTVGYCALAAAGATTVQITDGAREYLVVNVDTTNKEICILL